MTSSRTGAQLIAAVVIAVALVVCGLLLVAAEGGPEPVLHKRNRSTAVRAESSIRIAGSGSNVPLTRKLAAAYRRTGPVESVVVHDSIGSTGGIRAASDGVIDIGLTSRPLAADETAGLLVTGYARAAVVVAVRADSPDTSISTATLLEIYRGTRTTWPDGRPIVVIQRERGDSSHRSIARGLPGFDEANAVAWRTRRFALVYSDRAMEARLIRTRGGVGVADLGVISAQRLPLRGLGLDGVRPSPAAVASGTYPFFKDLRFVHRRPISPAVASFLSFAASPAGRAVIRDAGYLPLPLDPPDPPDPPDSPDSPEAK